MGMQARVRELPTDDGHPLKSCAYFRLLFALYCVRECRKIFDGATAASRQNLRPLPLAPSGPATNAWGKALPEMPVP